MSKLLLGRPVAESILQSVKKQVALLDRAVKVVTVGFSNPQWQQYAGSIAKSAANCGIVTENVVADGLEPQEFFRLVQEISSRGDVCGVLLQQPLPKQFAAAVNFVAPSKDIDCLCDASVAALYRGQDCLPPATPLAVLKLLDFYGVDLCGKNVVIVGRGNAVGKPLSLLCLKRNATVTVCHTKTVNLPAVCKKADIIVSACGVAGLVDKSFVTEHSVVVDVGLSFVDGKTCGDVSQDVYEAVSAVSPVPGGVGPVTRAALFENLLEAAKNLK